MTVSARLLSAFRIWLAATDVEVFSKALSGQVSFKSAAPFAFSGCGVAEGASEAMVGTVGDSVDVEG